MMTNLPVAVTNPLILTGIFTIGLLLAKAMIWFLDQF